MTWFFLNLVLKEITIASLGLILHSPEKSEQGVKDRFSRLWSGVQGRKIILVQDLLYCMHSFLW